MFRIPYRLQHLYVQVLIAISLAILLGHFDPKTAVEMKPLGDVLSN
jgi:aerobic C4-dicarboxylate transport protein